MLAFLSVDTVAFTLLGYSMSWIELVGTVFNLWCVWLAARKHIWTWPVGLVGTVLYFFLFYQIRLYADMGEQVYYFVTTFMGWWMWHRERHEKQLLVHTLSMRARMIWVLVTLVATALLVYVTTHLMVWFPLLFTQAPAYPWIDAATTIVSFVATYFLAKRYFDAWPLWIAVDLVAVWLYWVQGVKFVSLEYLIFLVIACIGAYDWYKQRLSQAISYEHASSPAA